MKNLNRKTTLALCLSLLACATHAADRFWDGGDGSWGTAASWDVGVPGTGDVAIFNDAGNNNVNQTITLDGARTVQGLTFNNAGTTALNAGTPGTSTLAVNNAGSANITLGSGGGNATIGTALILGVAGSGGVYTFDVASGKILAVNGQTSSLRTGNRTWTVNGGTLDLVGGIRLNSLTGNPNARGNSITGTGTLILGGAIVRDDSAIPVANASTLGTALGFGGTLRLSAASNNMSVAMSHAGGTMQFANSTSLPTAGLKWQGGALAAFGAARTINEFVDGNGNNSSLSITGNQDLTLANFWLSSVSGGSPTANRTLTVSNTGITTLGSLANSIRINPNASTAVSHVWEIQDNAHLKIAGALTQANVLGPSSITKSGNGILEMLVGTTYTVGAGGFAVSGGTLRVNNTSGSATSTATVTLAANTRLDGSGIISGQVAGAGHVHAGNSPGILTVGQVNPAAGMDFSFEFTQEIDPTWSNAVDSGNDVLRLTNGATPFTANLSADNVLNYYFDGAGTFRGGFYTDKDEDFTSNLAAATINYYIQFGGGSESYGGNTYNLLPASFVAKSVVQVGSADFAGGTVNNGWTQQFVVTIPEPGTLGLVLIAGLAGMAYSRKRSL